MTRNVKELISSSRDATELMLDLAFASVFLDDAELATEVLRLEEEMDDTVHDLRILCMLAARSPHDAQRLAGVLNLVNAMEEIADAAEDVARVTLRDLGVPPELRDDLRFADEVTAQIAIPSGSPMAGAALADLSLPANTGMWIIAIRRDLRYDYAISGATTLRAGDVVLMEGPADGVDLVRQIAGVEPDAHARPENTRALSDLDRAVDILVDMKNAAESAVGLAYSAVLFHDIGLAGEVSRIEDRCDSLHHDLQRWVLRAARTVEEDDDIDDLRALLEIGHAAEIITDAAQEMTRLAESPEETHPVISAALSDTDELVADVLLTAGSDLIGQTLGELALRTAVGADVLALRKGGRWINKPRSTRRLAEDDRLMVLAPPDGLQDLRTRAHDHRPVSLDDAT